MLCNHMTHSSTICRHDDQFTSPPIVRRTLGSGRGMRVYPWIMPGYGHGLTPRPRRTAEERFIDTRTAAERFLDNYDTVEAMFDEIRADPDANWDRRMLIDLMLATKAFHHHAAIIVWSSLGELGILPLLNIIKGFHIPTLRDGTRYVKSVRSSPTSYSIASASSPCPP